MEDLIAAIKDVEITSKISRDSINKVSKVKSKAQEAIEIGKRELTGLSDPKLSQDAFMESLQYVEGMASSIFDQEVQEATAKSAEYSNPKFKNALLSISDDSNLFEFIPRGTGWARNISVQLNMNQVAGDIDEYSYAVEEAREELRVKEDRDPAKASKFWREKVWGTGRYTRTINARLSRVGSPAPFWSLLNYGTASADMASSIGGTPYPRVRGTRFVQHSEDRLYKAFRNDFLQKREENKRHKDYIRESIRSLKQGLTTLENLLSELEQNFDRGKAIARKLGIPVKQVDVDKLLSDLDKYRKGLLRETSRVSVGPKRVPISQVAGYDMVGLSGRINY